MPELWTTEDSATMSLDRAIGLTCHDIWGTYFCEVLGGIQSAAGHSGYRVIAVKSPPRDVHRLELARDQIDGATRSTGGSP
ncbi:hypothetical protein BE04_13990 [Sorangium cellulosum]|uniref:Uncharacterized protein n=1 Tax=Sorangium cellulosum TaxID=56 RepID=A0A150P5L9_SORCE|nr:hypothetical protein BE04_13990 [Sorangium cellulosum]